MKSLILAAALVLILSATASAQNFQYFNNYGYGNYGPQFPYGGWAPNPYGYRAAWQYGYSPYGFGYGGAYGYGYGGGFGYSVYHPQLFFPGRSGTIPGYYTNGYFVPNW